MIKRLSNNPFRMLGIYANSTMRDIVANKGKMSAFIKVGKQVSFPLDLTSYLGNLNRTTESVAAADSQLTIENDKLLAAQFWFFNVSQFDSVAFNHLSSGNIDAAISIWEKKEEMSSLQNKAICYLIKNDIRKATTCLSTLYEKYKDEFVAALDIRRAVTLDEMVEGYISSILESEPNIEFSLLSNSDCSNAWNNAAKGKMVQPLIKDLTAAITKSKQSKDKTPKDRLESGKELNKEAKKLLFRLRQLLPSNDLQLMSISDKVANEVLQCGIDYYNDSDSPYSAYEALDLQNAASMFAMGTMVKERCKENCDILKKNMESLPPREIEKEHIAIQKALKKFCEAADEISYATILINEVQSPLSVVKQRLGVTHDYYIRMSSVVVGNALHNLIEEVNATQKAYNDAPVGSYSETAARNKYKSSVEAAWSLTQRIETFAMDSTTAQRFNQNKEILRGLYNQLQSNATVVSSDSSSSDDNSWSSCLIQILIYGGLALLFRTCS